MNQFQNPGAGSHHSCLTAHWGHEPSSGAPTFLSAWVSAEVLADRNVGAPTARFMESLDLQLGTPIGAMNRSGAERGRPRPLCASGMLPRVIRLVPSGRPKRARTPARRFMERATLLRSLRETRPTPARPEPRPTGATVLPVERRFPTGPVGGSAVGGEGPVGNRRSTQFLAARTGRRWWDCAHVGSYS